MATSAYTPTHFKSVAPTNANCEPLALGTIVCLMSDSGERFAAMVTGILLEGYRFDVLHNDADKVSEYTFTHKYIAACYLANTPLIQLVAVGVSPLEPKDKSDKLANWIWRNFDYDYTNNLAISI